MPSQQINSGFIYSITHDKNGFTVQFNSGKRFRYAGVPFKLYLAMCNALNPGGYYTQNIKGKFPGKKLNKNQA